MTVRLPLLWVFIAGLVLAGCLSPSPMHEAMSALSAKDYKRAAAFLKKAAEQGNPIAQRMLGDMYSKGQGLPRDPKQASEWYRLSAARANAGAYYALGRIHRDGDGVERDLVEAYYWFTKAAEQGDGTARVEALWLKTEMSSDQIEEAQRRIARK